MDYTRFLNQLTLGRQPSPIRELTKIVLTSGKDMISMAGGLPNPDMYPFSEITATMRDGTKIVLDGKLLDTSLQYGPTEGYPKLVEMMTDFQERLHKPPKGVERSVVIATGSMDALCKTFEMLLTLGEDYILADEYLYPGVVSILRPYRTKHLQVKGDAFGLRPDSLLEVLKPWGKPKDVGSKSKGVPKLIYLIPNGGNPVGTSISAERRKEIYKIAQDYNLLIIEDDPYYFVDYAKERAPSFLSLDVDGRVIRLDSFSKVISGGLRLGMITGPASLVRQVVSHMQVSIMHAPSAIQVILYELLTKWGFDGFLQHMKRIANFYESRRDQTNKVARKWLDGLAEWNLPIAGMFIWIRILGVKDTNRLVMEKLLPKLAAFLPGRVCTIDNADTPFIRISFSLVTDDEMEVAFQRLAEAIKEELKTSTSMKEVKG